MADQHYRTNAERLRDAIRGRDGLRDAADLIESMLLRGAPPPNPAN
jgi:UDP:flavonoid glycosyltransferase YjiC (YdhE family)